MTGAASPPSSPARTGEVVAAPPAPHLGRWRGALIAASLFLAAHLAYLAPTLDDIDAVNFAFGLREFDPAQHHPHPPGYPVYIVLGKMTVPIARAIRPPDRLSPLRDDDAALALALWSAVGGAAGLLACYAVFLQLGAFASARRGPPVVSPTGVLSPHSVALWAAVISTVAPLAWFTASRPMSDTPGLAAALVALALLLEAWRRDEYDAGAGLQSGSMVGDPLTRGAFVAGIALGIRSQVLWLTLPVLTFVLAARARRRGLRAALPAACAYVAAVAAWFIPMLVLTGVERYLVALGGQGGEDFAGVDMLWTHFGLRRFAVGLWQTFVLPWSSILLAAVVLSAALAGIVVMWRRARAALAWLALLALPYAVFHTLFHETITTRYALPLVPAVCYLAVRAFAVAPRRVAVALLLTVTGGSLAVGVPAIRAYAAAPCPIFQAVDVLDRQPTAPTAAPVLAMHRRVATEAKPALAWAAVQPWSRRLPSPRAQEWAEALRVLREEPGRGVSFLGEPARRGELRVRDLALIDARGVREVRQFRWNVRAQALLAGVRPDTVDLYEIREPGWIAGEGWALTPETAGVAEKSKRGPAYGPIEALVRRRSDEAVLLVGGRHLGGAADGPGRIELRIDGRPLADFAVEPQPQFFLQVLRIPAGTLSGPGDFGRLTVAARRADGAPGAMHVAIEQFDLDAAHGVVAGYDTGWQEPEYDARRQQMWRWASEQATVLVHAGGAGPLSLRLSGESPRRYFDRPSEVRIRVGGDVIWRQTPDARMPRLLARLLGASTFSASVAIDRSALARASGRITLETDQFFTPADRDQNADRRHLAVRIFDFRVLQSP